VSHKNKKPNLSALNIFFDLSLESC